jgi:hypothetical protein
MPPLRRFTVPENIDKPSDIEFAKAIVQNIPESGKKSVVKGAAAGYIVGKVIAHAVKKR